MPGHVYEVLWSREQPIKYLSHLDLMRVWERMLRRAKLPLAYTQGFNPRPRLTFAAPLPLGILAEQEHAYITFSETLEPEKALPALRAQAVPGLGVKSLRALPPGRAIPQVQCGVYRALLPESIDRCFLAQAAAELLAREELTVARRMFKGGQRLVDLRPLIEDLRVEEGPSPCLSMQLSLRPGATARPEEVLQVLGVDPKDSVITRVRLLFAGQSPR